MGVEPEPENMTPLTPSGCHAPGRSERAEMTDGHFMLPDKLANSIDHSLLAQKWAVPNETSDDVIQRNIRNEIIRQILKQLDLMQEAGKRRRELTLGGSDSLLSPELERPTPQTSESPFSANGRSPFSDRFGSPDQRIHATPKAPSHAFLLRPMLILAAILALLFLLSRSLLHESQIPSLPDPRNTSNPASLQKESAAHDLPGSTKASSLGPASWIEKARADPAAWINQGRIRSILRRADDTHYAGIVIEATSIRIDYPPDILQRFDISTSPTKHEKTLIIRWELTNNGVNDFYLDSIDHHPIVKTPTGRILKRWLPDQPLTPKNFPALFVEGRPVQFTIAPGQSFTDFGVYDIPPDPVFDLMGLEINFSAGGNDERMGRSTYSILDWPDLPKP
jgi:hypothetical protein